MLAATTRARGAAMLDGDPERGGPAMSMAAGVALRVAAGVALLAYAVVAFGHGNGVKPLLPAVVGAYLLIRGLSGLGAGNRP